MVKTAARAKRKLVAILILVMIITNFSGLGTVTNVKVQAATNGIVKGPNTTDATDSFDTTLSSGESTSIKIVNSVLTIKVSASEYIFKTGNITKTVDAAVVNERDGLLHILTLGGVYYVFDLYTGVQIIAYRNSTNGKYCSSRNSYAYMVYGKSLINNTYFYELLTSNSVSRELLMTRKEFDSIISGGDPSIDNPTATPTQEPTIVPTATPTQEPTIVPTQVPTATPTQEPTIAPTRTPTVEVDSKTEFDFEFWWKMYIDGKITWEQFSQIMWENHWSSTSQSTEKSTTYYFYDENGRLIRTETVTISDKSESGTGNGSATSKNEGKADVDIDIEGKGNITGESKTETDIFVNGPTTTTTTSISEKLSVSKEVIVLKAGASKTITYSAKNSNGTAVKAKVVNSSNVATARVVSKNKIEITASKNATNCMYSTVTVKNGSKTVKVTVIISKNNKKHARVVTSGHRIKLFTKLNSLHGWLLFDPKKGTLDWNGYKMKNVKSCGFIQGSWNVIVLMKNGTVYKLPKTVKKGQTVHKTRIKSEKGIALNRDSYGFVKYVKTKCGGLKNVSGK